MNYLVFLFTDQVTLSKILVYQALDRLKKNQMEWPLQKILHLISIFKDQKKIHHQFMTLFAKMVMFLY